MTRRTLAAAAAVLLTLLTFLAMAPAASAQDVGAPCFPTDPAPYPATGPATAIEPSLTLISGKLLPSTIGNLLLGGAQPGAVYCGTVFSTPITIPTAVADAAGRLKYSVAVPADFQVNTTHHFNVYRSRTLVGSFDFCVTKSGDIAKLSACAKSSGGGLPRTGTDVWRLVRIALALLAVGTTFVMVRRKRIAAHAAHAA